VHDIGKNIVGVVLACNSYEIIDLGVMVPTKQILDAAVEHKADIVGLSGLITPSLDEMVGVAKEMQRRGMKLPLLIGGATTSRQHTAVKIAGSYDPPVVHVHDASRAVGVVSAMLDKAQRKRFQAKNLEAQEQLRWVYETRASEPLRSLADARANAPRIEWRAEDVPTPAHTGRQVIADIPLAELVPFIDWTFFFHAWELKGSFPSLLDDPKQGAAARELYENAQQILRQLVQGGKLKAAATWGFWPAASEGDDVLLFTDDSRTEVLQRIPMLRNQAPLADGKPNTSLADFVAPRDAGLPDHVGAFAITAGLGADALAEAYQRDHDDYNSILVKALADRLAEAGAEWLHHRARVDWGYEADGEVPQADLIKERFRGIRPAFGYPACPDHGPKHALFELLDAPGIGMSLTEHGAMLPAASVSGLYFAHPESRYFVVGRLDRDQVHDYAERCGATVPEIEKRLSSSLGYDPDAPQA